MKKQTTFFMLLIFVTACNPISERNKYLSGTITIKGEVINPKSVIRLGDSVRFSFEVPDTVYLNGTKIKAAAGNADGGNVGFQAQKILPASQFGSTNDPAQNDCKIWASPGTLTNNGNFVLANQNGKLIGKYYIIPQKKGVYFFEQSEAGYIDLNNGGVKARFIFNFGNINRNHQVLIDSARSSPNFNLFLQDRILKGNEIYGFEVK